MSTENLLLLTAVVIGATLLVFAILLARRGCFHWISAGFWAWIAFMLYYVVAPLAAVFGGTTFPFEVRLQASGGVEHGIWVILVIVVGITVFFWVYLRTTWRQVNLGLRNETPTTTPFFFYWLLVFAGFGLFALLASRSGLAGWQGEEIIIDGRFVGDVTGYQNAGYMLLFFPIMLLLLWPHRWGRVAGLLLAAAFVILSIPHAWSRFASISMLLALSMWRVTAHQRRWPNLLIVLSLLLVSLIYQARGHTEWRFSETPQAIVESLNIVGDKGVTALAESDTQMLATFWVNSSWRDDWVGYDYGLRFLNYVLTGWIPSRVLPQKYFLVNWLSAQYPPYPAYFDQLLYGAKPSLIGSFYENGHIIAMILQIAFMGWFCRRLDGMLHPQSPIGVRALGISWLSVMWMVWGSGDTWSFMLLGTMAIPFLAGLPIFRMKGRVRSAEPLALPHRKPGVPASAGPSESTLPR